MSNDPDYGEPTGAAPSLTAADIDRMVAERISQTMSPLFQTADAVSRFGNEAGEINSYLSAHPDKLERFQRLVKGDPEGASEYARLNWQASRAAQVSAAADAGERQVRDVQASALQDAGVVGSVSRGGGRGVTPTSMEAHDEKLDKLLEKAEKTGDATAFMREKFFGGPDPLIEMWLPGEAPPPGMMKRRYKNLEEIL